MTQNLPTGMADMGVRTPEQIRDAMLRDIRNAAIANGRPPPDVSPGSFDHVRATALANHLALIEANGMMLGEQLGDDTAVGLDLERRAGNHNIFRRPRAGSIGPIVFVSSAPSPVAAGAELTGPTGLRFRVTVGGIFANGASIEVEAIDTGEATNLPAGTVLQWAAAPPYADPKVAVGPGGLVNGTEQETDDELRARYLARRRSPPTESNPQAMVERAERDNPAVQKAFVYPALLGPSTYALAVAASPTGSSRSRQIPATTVNNVVRPRVAGTHMDNVYPLIVSVVDEPVDYLSIGLALPAARSAAIPGAGGGWVNGQPWPPAESAHDYVCTVSAVTNSTEMLVVCDAEPQDGISRISWLRPNIDGSSSDWTLYSATVVSHSGAAGAWVIRLDRPLSGISVGCVIWPAAERQQAYVDALLNAFALMGPGEMTNQAPVLRRSARFPSPAVAWPYAVDSGLLRAISDSGTEVLSANRLRASKSAPTVNATAPRILTPRHIGLYPNPS